MICTSRTLCLTPQRFEPGQQSLASRVPRLLSTPQNQLAVLVSTTIAARMRTTARRNKDVHSFTMISILVQPMPYDQRHVESTIV